MQLFYFKEPKKEIELSSEESSHIVKVLRKKENDTLNFTDGMTYSRKFYLFQSVILSADRKKCKIKVIEKIKQPKQHNGYLHIVIAPTKNISRFEWFLEKSTEIGIDEITPVICSKSERKTINHERCNKIIISAMKQSVKFHLPKLNYLANFNDIIKINFNATKYIAHCQSKRELFEKQKFHENTMILIGPEGDFSEDEIQKAIGKKYKSISLGKSRLRTETAAVKASIINSILIK